MKEPGTRRWSRSGVATAVAAAVVLAAACGGETGHDPPDGSTLDAGVDGGPDPTDAEVWQDPPTVTVDLPPPTRSC